MKKQTAFLEKKKKFEESLENLKTMSNKDLQKEIKKEELELDEERKQIDVTMGFVKKQFEAIGARKKALLLKSDFIMKEQAEIKEKEEKILQTRKDLEDQQNTLVAVI